MLLSFPLSQSSSILLFLGTSIYDWTVNVSNRSPLQDLVTGGNTNLTGLGQWFGVLAWKRGALLVSFVWVALLVMVIDRQWKKATFWAMIGAFFSLFGIIHVPEAGFKSFSKPVWEQCVAYPNDCWDYAEQWMFFVSYLMLAGTFVLIEISRSTGFDSALLPPIEDTQDEEFSDWFRDAAIIVTPKSSKFLLPDDESKKTVKTSSDEKMLDEASDKKSVDDEIYA
jgi:hypothetical protein